MMGRAGHNFMALLLLAAAPAVLAVSMAHLPGLTAPIIEGPPMSAMESSSRVVSSSSAAAKDDPMGGLDLSKIADVLAKEPASAKGGDSSMDGLDLDCDDPEGALGEGEGEGMAAGAEGMPAGEGAGAEAGAEGEVGAPVPAAEEESAGAEAMEMGGTEAAPQGGGLASLPGMDDTVPTLEKLLADVRSEKGGGEQPADPAKAMRLAKQVQVLEDLIGHAKEINKLIPQKEEKLKKLKSELHSETAGARKQIAERKLVKQEALLKVVDEKLADLKERVSELEEVQKRLKEDIAATKADAGGGEGGSGGSGGGEGSAAPEEGAFLEHVNEMTSEYDQDW